MWQKFLQDDNDKSFDFCLEICMGELKSLYKKINLNV